ncbi:MAG: hemin transport system permease protein [Actinomycetota bacterium]|jgi:putative ABC transport system permease protein|nr:hemin transport system permease protein [Actinomycetota bacterium]
MFLALREMRRAKVRFGLLISAIGLLVLLILAQQALQNGLITSFIGAIERQSAPVLVYSVDGQRTFQGSIITPPLEKKILSTEGIGKSGRIGQGTFSVRLNDATDDSDAAIIGYTDPAVGAPDQLTSGWLPNGPGEGVGSDTDFSIGDRVKILGPGGPGQQTETIEVVGLADDAQLQVTPTLFVEWPDYLASVKSNNPDAGAVLPSAIGVAPVAGLDAATLAERINDSSPEADALPKQEAADQTPGVAEVKQSFQVIFLLFGLVVPLVTGLFFLIITLQKSASLILLRAIGASTGLLVRSLLFQVLLVIGGGLAIGIAFYTPLSQAQVGDIKLSFDVQAVITWSVILLVLGMLSALVAARRVLAVDPIEATTGEGGR